MKLPDKTPILYPRHDGGSDSDRIWGLLQITGEIYEKDVRHFSPSVTKYRSIEGAGRHDTTVSIRVRIFTFHCPLPPHRHVDNVKNGPGFLDLDHILHNSGVGGLFCLRLLVGTVSLCRGNLVTRIVGE